MRALLRVLNSVIFGFGGLLRPTDTVQWHLPPRGPSFWPPRLGAWPFTTSVINLFGGNFVWVLWLAHPVRYVFAATPLEDSMPSDHDSANAPATASSVYVIVHLAARPTRHGPRVGIKSWGGSFN